MDATNPWVGHVLRVYAQYPWIGILLVLMIIDYTTGVMASIVKGTGLSSKIGFAGMCRKVTILLVVGMCGVIQELQTDMPLAKLAAGFYSLNEIVSILENAKRIGVPVPPVIGNWLKTEESKNVTSPKPIGEVEIITKITAPTITKINGHDSQNNTTNGDEKI